MPPPPGQRPRVARAIETRARLAAEPVGSGEPRSAARPARTSGDHQRRVNSRPNCGLRGGSRLRRAPHPPIRPQVAETTAAGPHAAGVVTRNVTEYDQRKSKSVAPEPARTGCRPSFPFSESQDRG
jgi:hypothetical protein